MNNNVIPIGAQQEGDELEAKLVGAMLELPDQRPLLAATGLTKNDFTSVRLGVVWMLVARLAQRPGAEINAATVCSLGARTKWLSESDLGWLYSLQEANVLGREAALQLAEDVRARSRARVVRAALAAEIDLIDRGRFKPATARERLTTIAHGLATDFDVGGTAADDLRRLNARWADNVSAGKLAYSPTGIRLLDEAIGGEPPSLWFLQGRAGVGKNIVLATLVKAKLLLDAAEPKPARLCVVGLENGTRWLASRWQALALGMKIRDVGSKELTAEQHEMKARVDAEHLSLLERVDTVHGFRMSRAELMRRIAWAVFVKGATSVYIDNFREIQHVGPGDRDWVAGVWNTVETLRNFAEQNEVSVCVLVHDKDTEDKDGREGPPKPSNMMGGQDLAARGRLVLGVWLKGNALRMTVTKANELSEAGLHGPTIEFERYYEAGMVNPDGGRMVDLKGEAAKDRREQKDRAVEESVADSVRRAELKKKLEAANKSEEKPTEPPAQASLLDLPKAAKP